MTYSYITHTKQGRYFYLVFENDMESEQYLKITFLPHNPHMIFSSDSIDLHRIKMRDLEVLLLYIEAYGLTFITEGIQ
jgi:hypothetical protein